MGLDQIPNLLPLTVILPLAIAAFKIIFKSFTLDNFDLIFYNNEKKSLYTLVRNISINILFITIIFGLIFASAFLLSFQNDILDYIIIFWLIILGLFAIWLVSYYGFILINLFLKKIKCYVFINKRLNISNYFKSAAYLNLNYIVKFVIYYFSGMIPAVIFLSEMPSPSKITQSIVIDNAAYLILVLIITILLLMLSKKNVINHSIKFKYIDSYHNVVPRDLYLEKILDNSTHILTDKSNEYRAIKYINDENFDFVLRLYKAEKIEKNIHNNSTSESED